MPSERDALTHYKKRRGSVWNKLAYDEATSATLYALAFDTDKVQQITHLKHARRILNRFAKSSLSENDRPSVKKEMKDDKILKEAKDAILKSEPGYSSDKDAGRPLENEGDFHLWRTKAVRGEGAKKRIRTENAKNANKFHTKGKKEKGGRSGTGGCR